MPPKAGASALSHKATATRRLPRAAMAFEGVLAPIDPRPKRWRRAMLTVSLIVHGGLLAAGVAHSLWQVEALPLPSVEVTLTAQMPPPPPPPPPAGRKSTSEPRQRKTRPAELQQPRDQVNEPEPVVASE